MHHKTAIALAALALFAAPSAAHSWVEQLIAIDSTGTFTGNPGYARNNTLRTAPGFTDLLMVHILPADGQPTIEERDVDTMDIKPTDPVCKKFQQQQYQSNGSPRLSVAPGSMIALRYEENGHVTLPQNQRGKPANRGTVYIYGTTQPKPDDNFLDIFKVWNADGSGGDKRGKLLATQPYDDGQCYQVNSGNISQSRQQKYPHQPNQLMGTDLWCQNDIKIPSDAPTGKPYTLYWVWDWNTEAGVDPALPQGKAEVYTTCMDVDITAGSKARSLNEVRAVQGPDMNNAAIPAYVSSLNAAPSAAAPSAASPSSVISPSAAAAVATPSPAASQPVQVPSGSAPVAIAVPTSAGAPAQETPVASSTASQSMNAEIADSVLTSAIASIIASDLVAPKAQATATETDVTAPVTVTVTAGSAPLMASTTSFAIPAAPPVASAASAPGAASPTPPAAPPAASVASVPAAASPAAPAAPSAQSGPAEASSAAAPTAASATMAANPPFSSLSIQSPSMGSGYASPSGATKASGFLTFTGTARPVTPQASGTSSIAARSCQKGSCQKKRSNIFGGAAHRQFRL